MVFFLFLLSFSDNKIGSSSAQALASSLQYNSSLLNLDLGGLLAFLLSSSENNIDSSGVQALASTLQNNSSLLFLDLGS